MSDSQKKKRSKAYYGARPPKRRRLGRPEADLSPGMKGIIITTNVPEKRCVLEAYQILNEYGDKLYGPESCTDIASDSEEDIEEAIAKEMEGLKKGSQERRFQATNTGVKNVVFIQCRDPVDPCKLLHHLFKEIAQEGKQKSRFCQRMIPVMAVCRATQQDIARCAPPVLEPHFHMDDQVIKFAVNYRARNNNSVNRDAIIEQVASMVTKSNDYPHVVDLKSPDLVVNVDIIKNLCCLSVVKDFMTFRKYNLHVVMAPDEDCSAAPIPNRSDGTVQAASTDEHLVGDEKTFVATNSTRDDDVTTAVGKNGDVAKEGDGMCAGGCGQVTPALEQTSCEGSGEPQQTSCEGRGEPQQTSCEGSGEPPQTSCEGSGEPQQTSLCENTEP